MFEELARDVGFGPPEAELLGAAGRHVEPHFGGVVDHFYGVIAANPRARSVFDDDAQIERQKASLSGWLRGLFGGRYDEAYFEQRARIGRAHVRIGLDQRYMFSMMNVLRVRLGDALEASLVQAQWEPHRVRAASKALDCLLDLELAIMLETYREDYVAKIRRGERLATLGQLAATIGHELRNPLAVIDSSLHLLQRRGTGDPALRKHLDRIGRQVAVSNRIITDLLELVGDRPPNRAPVSLRELVDDAVLGLRRAEQVSFQSEVGDLEPRVDGSQIRQVLVNLLQNSVDAGATQVRVTARDVGGALELAVEDDGCGVSKEVRARAFDPLFTTKAKGSGLGLALCRRIAEKHGGRLTVAGAPGGGARFVLELPRAFGAP